MEGQGRPQRRTVRTSVATEFCCLALWDCLKVKWRCTFVLFFFGLSLGVPWAIAEEPPHEEIEEIEFRISWGGTKRQTWTGLVHVSQGELTDVKPLGFEEDASGGVHADSGKVYLLDKRPATYSGFDVRYRGPLDSQLKFDLVSDGQAKFQYEVSVADLLRNETRKKLGLEENQLVITRKPGDSLAVKFEYPDLVFDLAKKRQEKLKLEVRPNLTGMSTRMATLRYRIRSLKGGKPPTSQVVELNEAGSGEWTSIQMDLPQEEGIYDLQLDLEPNWYQAAFGSRQRAVSRSIQFVVLDGQARHTGLAIKQTPWKIVRTYQAGNLSVPKRNNFYLRRFASTQRKILGNDKRRQISGDRLLLELDPGGWQAIPITFEQPGKPHQIEIDYIAEPEISLGVSVLESDLTGQVSVVGCDSGIQIGNVSLGSSAIPTQGVHRMTLWPRGREGYLLLANRAPDATASCGEIRIKVGPQSLPVEPLKKANSVQFTEQRKILAYIQSSHLPELFAGLKRQDPILGYQLEDWSTYYQLADRLVQHLKYQGYRGAVLNVATEGSALFPCPTLNPSPRLDSGIFFSNGQDPVRKDVLKLLLAVFEREGLTLVPALKMETPIGELEFRKRSTELGLVNFRGGQRTSAQSQYPNYNALNVEVQKTAIELVGYLGERYQEYSCMESLCLVCNPQSFLLMAGREWGFDDLTIKRFESVANQQRGNNFTDFKRTLLTSRFEEWKNWRQNLIRQWHIQLGNELAMKKPGCRLLMYTEDLDRNEEIVSALSPSLHIKPDLEQALARVGIQFQSNYESSNTQMVGVSSVDAVSTLGERRVAIEAKRLINASSPFRSKQGSIEAITHRAVWTHFSDLQTAGFQEQNSPLMRMQVLTPTSQHSCREFVDRIYYNDAVWLMDCQEGLRHGLQQRDREFFDMYQTLPAQPMTDVDCLDGSSQAAVKVRQFQTSSGWIGYIVNHSPWQTNVQVKFSGNVNSLTTSSETQSQGLTAREPGKDQPSNQWKIWTLEPYQILVIQGGSDVRADSYRYRLPKTAKQQLQIALRKLQSQLMKANRAEAINVLENASFEYAADAGIEAWTTGDQEPAAIQVDPTTVKSGKQSLQLKFKQQPVWIRSNEFAAPRTGRLSVSAWIRSTGKQQPTVRIAVEGRTPQRSYYRFGAIGGNAVRKLNSQWQKFAVHFDDLPIQGMDKLRVGFDLMEPGTIWIDQVEVFDRWLDRNDSTAITQRLAGAETMLENQGSWNSARLVLDNYWARFLRENFGEKKQPNENLDVSRTRTSRQRRIWSRPKPALPFR